MVIADIVVLMAPQVQVVIAAYLVIRDLVALMASRVQADIVDIQEFLVQVATAVIVE